MSVSLNTTSLRSLVDVLASKMAVCGEVCKGPSIVKWTSLVVRLGQGAV